MLMTGKLVSRILPAMALSASILCMPLQAHEYKVGDLTVDHPWIRATPAGAKTAGGYVKITNNGKSADKLIGGSAAGAKRVEVHEMKVENNIMKMRELEGGLSIKAGETVELKPGSFHLMMMGLEAPYKEGDKVKGTISFEKAGKVDVEFAVNAMSKAKKGADGHKMGDHKKDGHH